MLPITGKILYIVKTPDGFFEKPLHDQETWNWKDPQAIQNRYGRYRHLSMLWRIYQRKTEDALIDMAYAKTTIMDWRCAVMRVSLKANLSRKLVDVIAVDLIKQIKDPMKVTPDDDIQMVPNPIFASESGLPWKYWSTRYG